MVHVEPSLVFGMDLLVWSSFEVPLDFDTDARRFFNRLAAPCSPLGAFEFTLSSTWLRPSRDSVSSTVFSAVPSSASSLRRSNSPFTSATSFRNLASFLSRLSLSSSLFNSTPLISWPSLRRLLLEDRYDFRLLLIRLENSGSRSPEGRKCVRASSASIRCRSIPFAPSSSS